MPTCAISRWRDWPSWRRRRDCQRCLQRDRKAHQGVADHARQAAVTVIDGREGRTRSAVGLPIPVQLMRSLDAVTTTELALVKTLIGGMKYIRRVCPTRSHPSFVRPRCTRGIVLPTPEWSLTPGGTCPSSTPASAMSIWQFAHARACSTSATWARSKSPVRTPLLPSN